MKAKPPRVLLRRSDVRLALGTSLSNAFATVTGLPDGVYAPLAVLAVCSGSYGQAVGLGRQRLLGTLLGAAVLVAFYKGLGYLGPVVGIALALGTQRLLGGLLNLQVGYKVGGVIIVMGWLVHHAQLTSWLPLRLFWTAFGILVSLAALRLLWPTSNLRDSWSGWATVLNQLATQLRIADGLRSTAPILNAMTAVRALRPALIDELGGPRSTHPALPLLALIEESCSRLLGVVERLKRRPLHQPLDALTQLREGEEALMQSLANQLERWAERLTAEKRLSWNAIPPPPTQALQLPEAWLLAEALIDDPEMNRVPLEILKTVAARLHLLRKAIETFQSTEQQWRRHHSGRRASGSNRG
jgi:uncharacterized membrane protein YccC